MVNNSGGDFNVVSLLDKISISPGMWYAAIDLLSDRLYIFVSKDDEKGIASS